MNEYENLVTEEVTENTEAVAAEENTGGVEQVAEAPKMYTEAEFNKKLDEVLAKKISRNTAKIRREYDKKYSKLENVLRAGTGKQDVEEITDLFTKHYEGRGVKIPTQPSYSDRDIEVLARAEADDIISSGMDEVKEEVDRLADIGLDKMNAREKAVFKVLAEYRKTAEQGSELAKIGVTEDVYSSKAFKDFAGKFNPKTPITEIYDLYNKTQPKKEIRTMGSMKSTTGETGIKEFYTVEEARRFTKKDFDNNPELFKAVERSMLKW